MYPCNCEGCCGEVDVPDFPCLDCFLICMKVRKAWTHHIEVRVTR